MSPVLPYGSVGDDILDFGSSAAVAAATTTYLGPIGHQTTAGNAAIPMPWGGTLRFLQVRCATAPGAGQTVTFTVFQNGVATSLTAQVAGTNTQAADDQHEVAVNQGDIITVQAVTSASAASSFLFAICSLLA